MCLFDFVGTLRSRADQMARAAGAQGTKKRRYGMFHSIHDANTARAKSRIYKNDEKRYNNPANVRRKPLYMEAISPYAGGGVF